MKIKPVRYRPPGDYLIRLDKILITPEYLLLDV